MVEESTVWRISNGKTRKYRMKNQYKGIVLAGGSGTRLHPITKGVSKQLLPVYDKPMIYYPISVLMLAGIKDILVISTPNDIESYQKLLGNGASFGVNFQYKVQESPNGIAEAFIIGEDFIGDSKVSLILGDNIFYGQNFSKHLLNAIENEKGGTIFGYHVNNPSAFGVLEIDKNQNILSIEEKPKIPKSNYAVTGLYFYDNDVIDIAKNLSLSDRGEYEITDINNILLKSNKLNVELFGRGFAWLDTGTHESLLQASLFVQTVENRQGLKIACLEEIAFNNNWIDFEMLKKSAEEQNKTIYGKYISGLVNDC